MTCYDGVTWRHLLPYTGNIMLPSLSPYKLFSTLNPQIFFSPIFIQKHSTLRDIVISHRHVSSFGFCSYVHIHVPLLFPRSWQFFPEEGDSGAFLTVDMEIHNYYMVSRPTWHQSSRWGICLCLVTSIHNRNNGRLHFTNAKNTGTSWGCLITNCWRE